MKLKVTSFSQENFLVKNINKLVIQSEIPTEWIRLIQEGFDIDEIKLYGLNEENYKHFLPNSVRHKISLLTNSGYWPILHDKMIFYTFAKDFLPTPKLLSLFFSGRCTSLDGFDLFESIYKNKAKYVLKPLQGGKGQGIYFIKVDAGDIYIQDVKYSIEEFKAFLNTLDKYGLFEFVNQHFSLSNIYAESANTIRLITLQDTETKEPYIFAATLRIGWDGSKPFDNFSQGGLISSIDIETGVASAWKRKDKQGFIEEGEVHPDTGVIIKGFAIPHWNLIKRDILKYLEKYPYLNYVGWDILVTDEGFTIIEGNHNPDLDLTQLFKGYLSDERSIRLFKSLSVI